MTGAMAGVMITLHLLLSCEQTVAVQSVCVREAVKGSKSACPLYYAAGGAEPQALMISCRFGLPLYPYIK